MKMFSDVLSRATWTALFGGCLYNILAHAEQMFNHGINRENLKHA